MSGSSSGSSTSSSPQKRVYLDFNATTPLAPEVIQAVEQSMHEAWGNPSSDHEEGARARTVINQARDDVARMIGAMPQDVLFMSGGTEVSVPTSDGQYFIFFFHKSDIVLVFTL